jgi:uncharacterized protein involved in tolerance to divalent cations
MIAAKANFVEVMLTCASWQEAQRVADNLLRQHLIGAVEFIPLKSRLWKTRLEDTTGIKLIMESVAEYAEKVEAEITKLHNYETVILQLVPIAQLSNQATIWLKGESDGLI